ncbi:hypothetical protein, partial [Streptomyces hydrogenans]|uniref:hypothetical protein n=1 Tax=Streptomyces hydrogenans TaxID=1873719 RepID=UPI001CFC9CB0
RASASCARSSASHTLAGQPPAVAEQLTAQRLQRDQELAARGLRRRQQGLRQLVEVGDGEG